MAALEPQYDSKDRSLRPPVQLMVQHQKKDFLLCSLFHGTLVQQQLDLDFTEGEQVTFYLEGDGVVHLTGYLVQEKPFDAEDEQILGSPPDSSEDGMEVSDDEESDSKEDHNETIPSLQQLVAGKDLESSDDNEEDWTPAEKEESTKKRKLTEESPSQKKKKSKQKKGVDDGESSDEEDGEADYEDITEEMADLFEDIEAHSRENGKNAEREDKGKGMKEKEETGDAEETSTKKKKRKKKKQQEKSQTENSKPKETNQTTDKSARTPAKLKKKLSNGVVIEDVVVGKGKLARPLRMVGVYYRGTLLGRKEEFDSCLTGKPFRFRLGAKEVISGWDSGLIGMRIGGKRKLTIPPSQGYGKSGAGGSIPPNSTLVFDVELKEVR